MTWFKLLLAATLPLSLGWLSDRPALAIEKETEKQTEKQTDGEQMLKIPSVLVRLIEQVDVPAREPGVLTEVSAGEGQMVREGQLLAQIDDSDARLIQRRAELELELDRQKNENDVAARMAAKSLEVARAELKRAEDSAKQFSKSVSQSELDFLRLSVERNELELEQARHELALATAALQLKENAIAQARNQVGRLRITAPINGVVAQVAKRRGEWVEPGVMVLRILRLDRLRAEGFIDAEHASNDLQGQSVRLVVESQNENRDPSHRSFPGEIVFVSPEIDPVNGQVRIWAEIDNRRLHLRPGMRGQLMIDPPATPK